LDVAEVAVIEVKSKGAAVAKGIVLRVQKAKWVERGCCNISALTEVEG
jgi:hypothetical protein